MWATMKHWLGVDHKTPDPDPDKEAALEAQAELRRRLEALGIEVAVVTRDRRKTQAVTPYRRRADDD